MGTFLIFLAMGPNLSLFAPLAPSLARRENYFPIQRVGARDRTP